MEDVARRCGDSGRTIIDRVKNSQVCSDKDRMLITWTTGTWLMEKCCGKIRYPTSAEFKKMAKSIVHFLPNAEVGGKTHWEMFYDCKTRQGFL
jgi:hypothetical protein